MACFFLSMAISRTITRPLSQLEQVIQRVGEGERHITESFDESEVGRIGQKFREMVNSNLELSEYLLHAQLKEREAQLLLLQAQINPHFLYNTLDTINWMAIDRDEYEISNMITTLARILRYGISDSNGVVKIRDEVEWLKQYIFLQQTKLKNSFDCHIDVEPELLDRSIHKLLLQPFLENAILHGFEGVDRTYSLQMVMRRDNDSIEIRIEDNGCGIPEEIVREMNQGIFRKTEDKNHIGMENAITRLYMYYGEKTNVVIKSRQGEGTLVQIRIPITGVEEKSESNSMERGHISHRRRRNS